MFIMHPLFAAFLLFTLLLALRKIREYESE